MLTLWASYTSFIISLFSLVLITGFFINLSSSATSFPNVPSQSAAGFWIATDICNKSSFRFSRGATVWPLLRFFASLKVGEQHSPSFSQVYGSDTVVDRFPAVSSDISNMSSGSLTVSSVFCCAAFASFTDSSSCNKGHLPLMHPNVIKIEQKISLYFHNTKHLHTVMVIASAHLICI